MAVAFVGGAALGAAFGELFAAVRKVSKTTVNFKPALKSLQETLSDIQPTIDEIVELDRQLGRARINFNLLILLKSGRELVIQCSNIGRLNLYSRYKYSTKLKKLNDSLREYFQVVGLAQIARDSRETLLLMKELASKRSKMSRSCSVPGPLKHVVGFAEPLEALKKMVLQSDDASGSVVVLSGHGGQGKTTLAKMLCHDSQITESFGANIFFVTFTENPNLDHIVRQLVRDMDFPDPHEFSTEEDAIHVLEKSLRLLEVDRILLVLDDVWSKSKKLLENFEFSVKGLKFFVTSRDRFPKYKNTYCLGLLGEKDSMKLFHKVAFPNVGDPGMPEELVSKIVKGCGGFPLALKVVGSSLCGRPVEMWSEWSNYNSKDDLFHCLQRSVDALNELPDYVKDCYQDLALFPEDEKIPIASLGDICAVLYNIDLRKTLLNLHELSLRNLADLTSTRKDNDMRTEISSDEHHVTQHDIVRELAIRQSNRQPMQERVRLNVDIRRDDPSSWPIDQPLNARIMSFSTDETFSSSWQDEHHPDLRKVKYWAHWFVSIILTMFGSFWKQKHLDMSCSKEMKFNSLKFPKVEALLLNLQSRNYSFPQFVKGMAQLKVLIVTNYGIGSTELRNLWVPCGLPSLRRIRLEHVSISSFDASIKKMENLQKISLRTCKIGEAFQNYPHKIPISLPNLTEIEIDCCYELERLPSGLCDLEQLTKLTIINCNELIELPDELGKLSNLQELTLYSCTKLSKLPESIGNLRKLSLLDISECIKLEVLPERMGELHGLRKLKMSGCMGVETLPESLKDLCHLEVVCDEEVSHLWNSYDNDKTHRKVKVVQRVNSLDWLRLE